MVGPKAKLVGALGGALLYAAAGGIVGSMNAGWFNIERNANPWLVLLGLGAGLVVIGFGPSRLHRDVSTTGAPGLAARYLLVAGPVLYVLSWAAEFAILGTLTLGLGLVFLSIAVWRGKVVPVVDRVLISLSAIGSLTWNTETVSAFLLVGVGLIWLALSLRLLPEDPLP